jgi:hypothetical protein
MPPKQVTASVSAILPVTGSQFFFTIKAALFSFPHGNFQKPASGFKKPVKKGSAEPVVSRMSLNQKLKYLK